MEIYLQSCYGKCFGCFLELCSSCCLAFLHSKQIEYEKKKSERKWEGDENDDRKKVKKEEYRNEFSVFFFGFG